MPNFNLAKRQENISPETKRITDESTIINELKLKKQELSRKFVEVQNRGTAAEKKEFMASLADTISSINLYKLKNEAGEILANESMGGNAGSYKFRGKENSCAALNAYVSKTSGEIKYLGNIQNLRADHPNFDQEQDKLLHLSFIEAMIFLNRDSMITPFVNFTNYKGNTNVPPLLNEILVKTMQKYNIAQVKSWNDLALMLEVMGKISTPQKEYSAAELKNLINLVKEDHAPLTLITREIGLRQKVKELLTITPKTR